MGAVGLGRADSRTVFFRTAPGRRGSAAECEVPDAVSLGPILALHEIRNRLKAGLQTAACERLAAFARLTAGAGSFFGY